MDPLWLIGILLGVLFALIGTVYALWSNRLARIDKDIDSGFAEIKEEVALWRDWRHGTLVPQLLDFQNKIGTIQEHLRQLEKWRNGKL